MILNWISVKNKLPKENGTYIVYIHDGKLANGQVWFDAVVGVADYTFGIWWCENDNDFDITNNVTHWMPLPEPPRMEEETNE